MHSLSGGGVAGARPAHTSVHTSKHAGLPVHAPTPRHAQQHSHRDVSTSAVRLQTLPSNTLPASQNQAREPAQAGPAAPAASLTHPAENNALLWSTGGSSSSSTREAGTPSTSGPSLLHATAPHTDLEFAKALNKEIVACRTWCQLRAILHAHAQSMNALHVSALVSRLAKVAPFPATSSYDDRAHTSSSSPASYSPAAAAAGSTSERSHAHAEHRALDHFFSEVSQLVSSRLDTFDARALSNILWAVAKLGFCPTHGLLQRFLFAAYVSMHEMGPQEVANLSWALATMHIHPGVPWLSRLLERTAASAHAMKPQEIAHSTWALQQLLDAHHASRAQQQQQQQQGQQRSAAASASAAAPSAGAAQPVSLELRYLRTLHVMQQSAEAGLDGFKGRELMILLLSLGRMWHSLAGRAEVARQPGAAAEMRSMTASHHRLLVAALQGPQLTMQLHTVSPLDVCNLCTLVARDIKLQSRTASLKGTSAACTWHMIMGQRALAHLARAVVADSERRMQEYTPQNLVAILAALSAMRAARLPPAWLSACTHHICHALLGAAPTTSTTHAGSLGAGASAQQRARATESLSTTLCALAKLGSRVAHTSNSSSSGISSNQASQQQGGQACVLSPAAVVAIERCVVGALPHTSAARMALLTWSLAELQVPWSTQLRAALRERIEHSLVAAQQQQQQEQQQHSQDARHSLTPPTPSAAAPAATRAGPRSASASPLPAATAAAAAAAAPAPLLSLSDAAALLWGTERLQLSLSPPAARALAHATAAAATAATSPDLDAWAHSDRRGTGSRITAVRTVLSTSGDSMSSSSSVSNSRGGSVGASGKIAAAPAPSTHDPNHPSSMPAASQAANTFVSHHCQHLSYSTISVSRNSVQQQQQCTAANTSVSHHRDATATSATPSHTPISTANATLTPPPPPPQKQHHQHVSKIATMEAVRGAGSAPQRGGLQDLASAAVSLCGMHARRQGAVLQGATKGALEQALVASSRAFTPRQLATLVMALGRAKVRPSKQLLSALLAQATHLLPSFNASHTSRLLRGLASMGYRPPSVWVGRVLGLTQSLLASSSPEEVSWMLWAFAKLRVMPPRSWLDAWLLHARANGFHVHDNPRAAVRAAWALQALNLKLPGDNKGELVQAAVQHVHRLSCSEALWLLRVAVTSQLFLSHEDWGHLLLAGVLQGLPPSEAVAHMPLQQQHLLLCCMAHHHMRWTRCWQTWREVHSALGGKHSEGGHGLVGTWRRLTRPRRWERAQMHALSSTQKRRQRMLLARTWEKYKVAKPRQFCSIWKHREKFWAS